MRKRESERAGERERTKKEQELLSAIQPQNRMLWREGSIRDRGGCSN